MNDVEIVVARVRSEYPSITTSLARRPERVGLVRYLAFERRKIAKWNKTSGVIRVGPLGLSLGLSPDFRKRIDRILTEQAFPLYSDATRILEQGWQWSFLTIREYNTIVLYIDLCDRMMDLAEKTTEPNIFKLVESILRLTVNTEYKNLLVSAFRKALILHNTGEQRSKDDANRKIDKLDHFLAGSGRSNIYILILGYCMTISRKFLSWKDLAKTPRGEWLSSEFYHCSPEVLAALVQFVKKLTTEIDTFTARIHRLETIEQLSMFDPSSPPPELLALYERDGDNWAQDSEDAFFFAVTLFAKLAGDIELVFRKKIDVMTPDEKIQAVRLVDDAEISKAFNDFKELYNTADLRYQTVGNTGIPVAALRSQGPIEDTVTAEAYKSLATSIRDLISLSYRIGTLLADKRDDMIRSSNPIMRCMIVNPRFLRGRPASETLTTYARYTLQIARYFNAKELDAELRRLVALRSARERHKEQLERLDGSGIIEKNLRNESPEGGIRRP